MVVPQTPQMVTQDGAIHVDHLSGITFEKAPFAPGVSPSKAVEVKAARQVEQDEAGGVSTWLNEGFFLGASSNGSQAQMASTNTAKCCSQMNWHGVGFTAPSTAEVVSVAMTLRVMAQWPATGDAGDAAVRFVLIALGGHSTGLYALDYTTQWTGSTAQATKFQVDVTAAFRGLLGLYGQQPMMIGQIATLLNLGTSTDASIKCQVSSNIGATESYVTAWKAGLLTLDVQYYTTNPEKQGSASFRISTNSADMAGSQVALLTATTDDNVLTLPSNTLAAGTYYVQPSQTTEGGTASAWGTPISFTTLPDGAARLVHDRGAELVLIAECRFPWIVDAGLWRLYDATTAGRFIYRAPLNRSSLPQQPLLLAPGVDAGKNLPLWVSGIEEEATAPTYTEVHSVADLTANKRFFWDEKNDGTQSYLYVVTSDGQSPAGAKMFGLKLIFSFAVANAAGWWVGPGGAYYAQPRIVGDFTVTEKVDDLVQGYHSSPSGTLTLDNHDGMFNRFFALPVAQQGGVLGLYRRVLVSYVGLHRYGGTTPQRVPYSERLPLLDGIVSLSGLVPRENLTLTISGREFVGKLSNYATRKYTKSQYPKLRDRDAGQVMGEYKGRTHYYAKGAVVDTNAKVLRFAYDEGAVIDIYCGEFLFPRNKWSYNHATHHVTLIGTYLTGRTWDSDKNAEWTATLDGTEFEGSYNLGAGVPTDAVHLARQCLSELGIDAADVVTGSFTALAGAGACAFRMTSQTARIEALRRLEASASFHVIVRQDGKFAAISDVPTRYGINSIIIRDRPDLLGTGRGEVSPYTGHMGSSIAIRYTQNLRAAEPTIELTGYSLETRAFWGIDTSVPFETYHQTLVGVVAASKRVLWERPFLHEKVVVGLKGWVAPIGSTLVRLSEDAQSADGRWVWDLFQNRLRVGRFGKTAEVEMENRWIGRLEPPARP